MGLENLSQLQLLPALGSIAPQFAREILPFSLGVFLLGLFSLYRAEKRVSQIGRDYLSDLGPLCVARSVLVVLVTGLGAPWRSLSTRVLC